MDYQYHGYGSGFHEAQGDDYVYETDDRLGPSNVRLKRVQLQQTLCNSV